MKIYIWENVTAVTNNYHDGGGIAVIAESREAARALLPYKKCGAHVAEPDAEYEIAGDAAPRVFVFPDAGCC